MPFLNKTLSLSTVEGVNTNDRIYTLLEPLRYFSQSKGKAYQVLTGSISDGLSVPQAFTNIIPPCGKGFWSGIWHDALYHECVEQMREDGGWQVPGFTKADKDLLLREALLGQGFSDAEADIIFQAVNWGGEGALVSDLSLPIPKAP